MEIAISDGFLLLISVIPTGQTSCLLCASDIPESLNRFSVRARLVALPINPINARSVFEQQHLL